MTKNLKKIEVDGTEEVLHNEKIRRLREYKHQRTNMDITDLKVLNHGFVSIQ